MIKILYVAPLFPGSTALHRKMALQSLGCDVVSIDTTLPFGRLGDLNRYRKLVYSVVSRTNWLFDWRRINKNVIRLSRKSGFDLLWIDKGQWISPETLQVFRTLQPKASIVNYSPDDMFNIRNQTDCWKACLPIYDLFVTTKSYNVREYIDAGARDALFVEKSFEPTIHRPQSLSQEERRQWQSDVVFIGAYEAERRRSIEFLSRKGVSLGLYGGGDSWPRMAKNYPNVRAHATFVADELYAKILCCSKIALGFLRKENRDLQTARSIEIPACGVFMLAERTDEHLMLFEEGREAEFFGSNEEMFEKINFYLQNDTQRKMIALAGRERCLRSGYSNAHRLMQVLEHLGFHVMSPKT